MLFDELFFKKQDFFIYVKGRVQGGGETERDFPLPETQPGIRNSFQLFHVGGRGLNAWASFHCFPKCISWEPDRKWGS